MQPFNQPPPTLANQYEEDRVLRSYLQRVLSQEQIQDIEPTLREMGALAGGELYQMQLADRLNEPVLTQWNPWGERIDHVEVSPLWKRAEQLAAEHGLIATAYEGKHGALSRVHQFALVYLFGPSTDVYICPLAMTDGAVSTLQQTGNQELIDRAIPHLTSRDPAQFWTSGQWMTESTGGSDVGQTETIARQDSDGTWRLYGRKWFTSAVSAQMALTLGRPEGNGPGGRGLALFYVELRDEQGNLQNIEVNRLKDKLGTRKVPTAELTLTGTPARLVKEANNGIRNISPMLNVTRLWNCIGAISGMRRGLALARNFAPKRFAFGAPLSEKPLHVDTLAGLQAEFEGAFHLTFYVIEQLGKRDHGELSEQEQLLLRMLTPIAKLTTGKQAVQVTSEILESFGGAGYVEDTGLPLLLRDSQVLPIWEGTTNVLSLDTLRAIRENSGLGGLKQNVHRWLEPITDPQLSQLARTAQDTITRAEGWLMKSMQEHQDAIEAGARRFAMTLGRSLELALLVRHAHWSLQHEHDGRARAAAARFALNGIDLLAPAVSREHSQALANDLPLPI